MIRSLYVHVPFCLRKCKYCDFYSLPVVGCRELFHRYPRLLEEELRLWNQQVELNSLSTIYFGGGTPSLLPPEDIAHFLSQLNYLQAEITLEANPETLTPQNLHGFRAAGINRLSIGAQSFDPKHLMNMGRSHTPEQIRAAVRAGRTAGFTNIGLDLIYGLPEQTLAEWEKDVDQALELETEHISLYGLTVSADCPWGREGIHAQHDDMQADMVELAMDKLTQAGFVHYEIANFAKPGYASRHNTAYWKREDYLGLGPAGASCIGNRRWTNLNDLSRWAASLDQHDLPLLAEEQLTIDQVIAEAIFLGLRLLDGVDCLAFAEQYGVDPRKRFKREIQRMEKAGLLEEMQDRLRLTRRGVMLGDAVFAEFM